MLRAVPELLVPAGGPEQLKAAVANGADAVYMSGRSFNARISAENFSDEELIQAVDFAHTWGVDAHIAMNTLLKDEEMDRALDFACRMYEAGADALIVQDPGLIAGLRRDCPDLTLHMSTQGSVYDAAGAEAVQAMGMKRVITARELSLEEIRDICRSVDIEVEVFVHGAICIGYSGQCHLSGTIGGRSGNRGECAQPCRLPYELAAINRETGEAGRTAARGYLLSPHDMSLLDHLRELAEAGVASLKVEGRLKSPEYVASATAVYRRHLDRLREENSPVPRSEYAADIAVLRQVFSRGPFTDTYLRGKSGSELMAAETPKHTGIKIGELLRTDRKRGHAQIRLTAPLRNGDGVEIRDGGRSCGNLITYIRGKNGKLIRQAEPGMTVTIGDLEPERLGSLREGAPVFRITDSLLMKELQHSYEKMPPRVPADIHLKAVAGLPAVLTAAAEQGGVRHFVSVESDEPLARADSRPLQEERVRKSLEKTGGTPYILRKLDMVIEGDPFLTSAELNAMRRKALEALTEERVASCRPSAKTSSEEMEDGTRDEAPEKSCGTDAAETVPAVQVPAGRNEIVLYFYHERGAEQRIREMAEQIKSMQDGEEQPAVCFAVPYRLLLKEQSGSAIPPEASELALALCDADVRTYAVLPAVTRTLAGERREAVFDGLAMLHANRLIEGVYAANLSHITSLRKRKIPFLADVSMNILNRESVRAVSSLGASGAVLSYEPDALENRSMENVAQIPLEAVIYGRTPVMYMAHCPVGAVGIAPKDSRRPDCTPSRKHYYCRQENWVLRDRKNAAFPVIPDSDDCSAVLYSHTAADRTAKIAAAAGTGVSRFRICVFSENPKELLEVVEKTLISFGDIKDF